MTQRVCVTGATGQASLPGVSLTRDVGEFGTLLAIDRARQALGFEPGHSWRDQMTRDQMTRDQMT